MRYLVLATLLTFLGLRAASAEEFSPSELAGKWHGTPPSGGTITINIEVSASGEIKGSGLIPRGGNRGSAPNVEGKVEGRKVNINYWFSKSGGTVRFNCDWVEKNVLDCITRNKKHQTEFKRLD